MQIPKVIHYCWFGHNPLPEEAQKCIASWRKFFPDYEIKEWNEDNFDVNSINYTREAYRKKRYAFVSDYARFWILFNYGGFYFDTDVEVIKSFDDIIERGPYMGLEQDFTGGHLGNVWDTYEFACNPGLGMAAYPKMELYGKVLDLYKTLRFIFPSGVLNLKTVVRYTSEQMVESGYKPSKGITMFKDIYFYPKEYFCPKINADGSISVTENTHSIHHYTATWVDKGFVAKLKDKCISLISRVFPKRITLMLRRYFHMIIGRKD